MKRRSSGCDQCYNVQIAVDEADRIMVATGVTQSASDIHQLVPLLEQVEATTGVRPGRTLADAGYRSESNLQFLERRQAPATQSRKPAFRSRVSSAKKT